VCEREREIERERERALSSRHFSAYLGRKGRGEEEKRR
jgi:hypothetical protein